MIACKSEYDLRLYINKCVILFLTIGDIVFKPYPWNPWEQGHPGRRGFHRRAIVCSILARLQLPIIRCALYIYIYIYIYTHIHTYILLMCFCKIHTLDASLQQLKHVHRFSWYLATFCRVILGAVSQNRQSVPTMVQSQSQKSPPGGWWWYRICLPVCRMSL